MDDKIAPPSETAEYKFTESESGSVDSIPTEQPNLDNVVPESQKTYFKFSFKNIDRKRLFVPGSIVISILLVYMAFSFFASKKSQDAELKKVTEQTDAAALMQQQAMMNAGVAKPTSISTDLGIGSDQMTQMQNAIQQKIDNISQQITSNQGSVANLSDTVTKTEQDISGINQHLDQLTTAMQQMLLEIETIKEAITPKPKKKARAVPVAYHIRAIVPGRVWLESAKGKSVSLRVGNKLEGYGVVRVISPRQGMVVMSNGSIIQYGVNDF